MTATSFNDEWTFRPKASLFAELGMGTPQPYRPIRLPHDAVIGTARDPELEGGSPSGYYRGGVFEYVKRFDAPAEWAGQRVWFDVEACYRDPQVFLNGAFAGQWAYGYTDFLLDATPYLKPGETNELRIECRAGKDSRWYAGAGLHRGVNLIVKPAVHIAPFGVVVTTPEIEPGLAVVAVATEVVNDSPATCTVDVRTSLTGTPAADGAAGGELPTTDGAASGDQAAPPATARVTLHPGDRTVVRQRLYVRAPRLWSPGAPNLYDVSVELLDPAAPEVAPSDRERLTTGIRRLQLDPDHGLRINGEVVKLRGACIHHDNGPLGAAAIARADHRRIELLRAAGFNAIRSAHNPCSRAMLEACDRLGVLVMDEAFDMWATAKSDWDYAHDFPAWWRRDVEAMVAKDRNHPSVILYSIGNEIPEVGNPHGAAVGRALAEAVREADPTRYVTNGVNCMLACMDRIQVMMAQFGAGAAPDAAGINTMMSQMGELMNSLSVAPFVSEAIAEASAEIDVLGLNYGDARYELEARSDPNRLVMGSETFPSHIAENWRLVRAHAHVLGDFTWTGWDYLGEAGIGGIGYLVDGATPGTEKAYPWLTAATGDLDITGHRLPVSYYREIVFGLRTEPYLAVCRPARHGQDSFSTPWAWSDSIASWTWPGFEGEPVTVEVYADAEEVRLELDGLEVGVAKVGETKPFRAEFETVYAPGELVAVAVREGRETGRCSLRTAGEASSLALSVERAEIRADDRDLAYVAVELHDADGAAVPGPDRPVTLELSGPAVLQGFGSGDPASAEPFDAATHTTFDGRALAILRPTGAGEITLTASAEGCAPGSATVTAR